MRYWITKRRETWYVWGIQLELLVLYTGLALILLIIWLFF